MVDFKAVGISYQSTPLEIRESIALSEGECKSFLLKLRETFNIQEALIVSTCNRTEIYYTHEEELNDRIVKLLCVEKTLNRRSVAGYFRSYSSSEAINHLFEVSIGLDSKILGDIQIVHQVKRAYQLSADLDLAGPFLHRLMHTIFYANKRVVQETRLQDGNASVASVTVDVVKRFIDKIAGPRIALIGLGEIGQNILENLSGVDAEICLLNRTKEKAQALANSPNISVAGFEMLDDAVNNSDVVISAVSSGKVIIDKCRVSDSEVIHKTFIDLSVPRSIAEEVGKIPGITLYNVDQLSQKTTKALKVRESAVEEVRAILREAIESFDDWKKEMNVSPTIKKLKDALNTIRKEELARHSGKVSEGEMELLDVVTKNMIQKVINLPIVSLKAACKRGETDTLVDVINDLFNLEKEQVRKS